MKIIVAGGTGLLGSRVVRTLDTRGHQVIAACRRSGVDAMTGIGLHAALEDASVVIDVTDSPSFSEGAATRFLRTSTRNLLAAGLSSGIQHHVMLSVVGAEDLGESGYVRAKLDQERLVAESGLPYSIVRSTQLLESISMIADDATQSQTVCVPPVRVQPVAAEDLAIAIGDVATGPPVNGVVEVAGPDTLRLDELVRDSLSARNDPRTVVAQPEARYLGARLMDRTLLPRSGAALGTTRLIDWLGQGATSHVTNVTRPSVDRGGTKLLRDRIDPRHLAPEVLIDALFEAQMHVDDDYREQQAMQSAAHCEVSVHADRDER